MLFWITLSGALMALGAFVTWRETRSEAYLRHGQNATGMVVAFAADNHPSPARLRRVVVQIIDHQGCVRHLVERPYAATREFRLGEPVQVLWRPSAPQAGAVLQPVVIAAPSVDGPSRKIKGARKIA